MLRGKERDVTKMVSLHQRGRKKTVTLIFPEGVGSKDLELNHDLCEVVHPNGLGDKVRFAVKKVVQNWR